MKTAIALFVATGITESLGNAVVDKAAPRPCKTYPTKVRLLLAVGMTVALHYALPFVENKVLGDKPAPKTIFG
jgi:hypothetical protein